MNYSCRICRAVLIDSEELLVKKHPIGDDGRPCSSYFLEETPSWFVNADVNITEGKIMCFQCQARVGNWNWSGAKCSCGIWVTPAFQFVCSKLDMRKKMITTTVTSIEAKSEKEICTDTTHAESETTTTM